MCEPKKRHNSITPGQQIDKYIIDICINTKIEVTITNMTNHLCLWNICHVSCASLCNLASSEDTCTAQPQKRCICGCAFNEQSRSPVKHPQPIAKNTCQTPLSTACTLVFGCHHRDTHRRHAAFTYGCAPLANGMEPHKRNSTEVSANHMARQRHQSFVV